MNFIIDNWYIILAMIAVFIAVVVLAIRFFKSGWEKSLNKLREWLLYAVTLAEKELGSGTGVLKLRFVYDLFTTKFPWLVKMVSFERFSELVDDALDELETLLACNESVEEYVAGHAPTSTKNTKEGE